MYGFIERARSESALLPGEQCPGSGNEQRKKHGQLKRGELTTSIQPRGPLISRTGHAQPSDLRNAKEHSSLSAETGPGPLVNRKMSIVAHVKCSTQFSG